MIPVILSGGSGTRLWPLSRSTHPKQFWPLVSETSLLQDTCRRVAGHPDSLPPIVLCNQEHRFFVADQLQQLGLQEPAILLEPAGRNTAPAVAAAAFHALASRPGEDPLLAVFPADHVINDTAALHSALSLARKLGLEGRLVTFGIRPHYPETGYGYIQGGAPIGEGPARLIRRFVEKPDRALAASYLQSGEYLWNSGMFVFRASRYLAELKANAPLIHAQAELAYHRASRDLDFIRLDAEAFQACPGDSIDYAVMEHTRQGAVIPLDAGWNDVGSWSALWEMGSKDEAGNVQQGDVVAVDAQDCYLRGENRLLAALGVRDLVVVDTPDVVLVADRARVQEVKQLVTRLSQAQREECDIHARVHRPWGCYQGIDRGERYQVKRVTVKPGASLSLQRHQQRAEHWVVVRGTARVTRGEETFLLSENQSTYIPIGVKHRLENPGDSPLEIVEVQSGGYLGEDDIQRFDDRYGRTPDSAGPDQGD